MVSLRDKVGAFDPAETPLSRGLSKSPEGPEASFQGVMVGLVLGVCMWGLVALVWWML